MPYLPLNFGLLEPDDSTYATSRAVILPVPFERTTSYGKGTARGPQAIIAASHSLELYDEELDTEPYRQGIATLPPFLPGSFDLGGGFEELAAEVGRHLERDKFVLTLGGEHSLTLGPVLACRRRFGEIGVVQFDAHADLREEYEGTPFSHACVMRRVVETGAPTLAIGLRSLSASEAAFARQRGLSIVWARELAALDEDRLAERLAALPEVVYLTFDVDYFDPALVPATGTPEPGGGSWLPTLALLRRLFSSKRVAAMDLVELAPIGGQPASDFLVAKLAYKCLAYRAAAMADASPSGR